MFPARLNAVVRAMTQLWGGKCEDILSGAETNFKGGSISPLDRNRDDPLRCKYTNEMTFQSVFVAWLRTQQLSTKSDWPAPFLHLIVENFTCKMTLIHFLPLLVRLEIEVREQAQQDASVYTE